MQLSKKKQLKQLSAKIDSHKNILSKYEKNPPSSSNEHKTKELSERIIRELQAQHDSISRND